MQMKKSYHMIRAHEHGRCPTVQEYRDAITYGSRFPHEQKYSLRVSIIEAPLGKKIIDWYRTVCTHHPADYENFKEQFQNMLLYHFVPYTYKKRNGEDYDALTEKQIQQIIQGQGKSWGGLSDFDIWCVYREHLVTYLLHCGYVTSYLKNLGFMGQMMCTQIGEHVVSFNERFGHLWGPTQPMMLVAHHTDPHVINSRMLTWTHDTIEDQGVKLAETHHVGEFVEQQNFLIDAETKALTPITRKTQIPEGVENFYRYYTMLEDHYEGDGGHTHRDFQTHLHPTTTAEGEPI